jgi:hypothetical protein
MMLSLIQKAEISLPFTLFLFTIVTKIAISSFVSVCNRSILAECVRETLSLWREPHSILDLLQATRKHAVSTVSGSFHSQSPFSLDESHSTSVLLLAVEGAPAITDRIKRVGITVASGRWPICKHIQIAAVNQKGQEFRSRPCRRTARERERQELRPRRVEGLECVTFGRSVRR